MMVLGLSLAGYTVHLVHISVLLRMSQENMKDTEVFEECDGSPEGSEESLEESDSDEEPCPLEL